MTDTILKKVTVYYWSGTGNSYRVASWMGKMVGDSGLDGHVLSIDDARSAEGRRAEAGEIVGVVFPTHGFTIPFHALRFVWNLPRGYSARAFCVATRAGFKFGPVFIPGISGSGTFIVALLLMFKGYNVCGVMSVDMPSNWFTLHPIQNRKSHEAIIGRAEHKVSGFMNRVLSKSKIWLTGNNLYEIIFGISLLPVSAGYLLFGRFFLAKLFFANQNCDGCGICAKHCSVKAIMMWGKGRRRPFWRYNCESCMRCAAICPHNAIEAGHSWGVILYVITALPFSYYLFLLFSTEFMGLEQLEGHWVGKALNVIYVYPAIFISYFIFSILLRVPFINYLFTYTTMTHLPFWGRYREPDTKLKDIS